MESTGLRGFLERRRRKTAGGAGPPGGPGESSVGDPGYDGRVTLGDEGGAEPQPPEQGSNVERREGEEPRT